MNIFFGLFTTSKFGLFIYLSRLDTVLSKIVFANKFPCANLALKTSATKVLKSGLVIYLSWLWLLSLFSVSEVLVLQSLFLTRLLALGILFPTVFHAVFVAKLLTSGILTSISVILVL